MKTNVLPSNQKYLVPHLCILRQRPGKGSVRGAGNQLQVGVGGVCGPETDEGSVHTKDQPHSFIHNYSGFPLIIGIKESPDETLKFK